MAAPETGSSSVQGKIQGKSKRVAKNHGNEIPSPSSSVTHGSPSVSRPSSNYNNRSQQSIGPQKGNFEQLNNYNCLLHSLYHLVLLISLHILPLHGTDIDVLGVHMFYVCLFFILLFYKIYIYLVSVFNSWFY